LTDLHATADPQGREHLMARDGCRPVPLVEGALVTHVRVESHTQSH
jgi:hypothetical protein